MLLLIDDANLSEIRRLYDLYPIDGVTTNPTILSKTGRAPYDVLCELRSFLGKEGMLHVQALSRRAEEIVREAEVIVSRLGAYTYVKIPAVPEGIKAICSLSRQGIGTLATAVYTPMQAFMAAKAGAAFVAPYVNRIDNTGGSGIDAVKEMQRIFRANSLPTKILAASFKNARQVQVLCEAGIDAATVSPQVLDAFLSNPAVDAAVDGFVRDFETLCGPGATMLDPLG